MVGFDIDQRRIFELESGIDRTNELSVSELEAANGLRFTSNPEILKDCNCYIITVPTPILKPSKVCSTDNNSPSCLFTLLDTALIIC